MKNIILAEKVLMNGAWQHNQVLSIEKGVIADIAPLSYFKKGIFIYYIEMDSKSCVSAMFSLKTYQPKED